MKHYEKPQIFMEEFTMGEHIARCGMNHNDDLGWMGLVKVKGNQYEGQCSITYTWDDGTENHVFLSSMVDICHDSNEDINIGGCYQGQQEPDMVLYGS